MTMTSASATHIVLRDTRLVQKVPKTRVRNGVREAYVKWLGWPDKCNGGIRESDVTQTFD